MKSIMSRGIVIALFFTSIFTMEIFSQSVKYNGDVEFGVVATRMFAKAQIDLSTTHGVYFSKQKLFVGAGASLGCNIKGEFWKKVFPVYGDIRKDFTINRLFTAFIDAKAGYSFNGDSTGALCDCGLNYGFYCYPSIGIRLAVFNRFGIFLKVGYTYQAATESYLWYGVTKHEGKDKYNSGGFSTSIGLSF